MVYVEDDKVQSSTQLDLAIDAFLATVSHIREVPRGQTHTWEAMELALKERIRIATFLRHCSESADIACALRQYAPVRHVRKENGNIVREFCVADEDDTGYKVDSIADEPDVEVHSDGVAKTSGRPAGNGFLRFFVEKAVSN